MGTVNTQRTKYLNNEADLVTEGNEEVRTCKKHRYLGITLNREGTNDQEMNNNKNKKDYRTSG
jgi:hypothetical protein